MLGLGCPSEAPARAPLPARPRPQVTFCPGSLGSGAAAMGTSRRLHPGPARPGPARAEAPPLGGRCQRKPRPPAPGAILGSVSAALQWRRWPRPSPLFIQRATPSPRGAPPPCRPAPREGRAREATPHPGCGRHREAAPLPSQPPPFAPTAISNRRPRSCSACSAPGARRGGGGGRSPPPLCPARGPRRVLCPSGPAEPRAPAAPLPPRGFKAAPLGALRETDGDNMEGLARY